MSYLGVNVCERNSFIAPKHESEKNKNGWTWVETFWSVQKREIGKCVWYQMLGVWLTDRKILKIFLTLRNTRKIEWLFFVYVREKKNILNVISRVCEVENAVAGCVIDWLESWNIPEASEHEENWMVRFCTGLFGKKENNVWCQMCMRLRTLLIGRSWNILEAPKH